MYIRSNAILSKIQQCFTHFSDVYIYIYKYCIFRHIFSIFVYYFCNHFLKTTIQKDCWKLKLIHALYIQTYLDQGRCESIVQLDWFCGSHNAQRQQWLWWHLRRLWRWAQDDTGDSCHNGGYSNWGLRFNFYIKIIFIFCFCRSFHRQLRHRPHQRPPLPYRQLKPRHCRQQWPSQLQPPPKPQQQARPQPQRRLLRPLKQRQPSTLNQSHWTIHQSSAIDCPNFRSQQANRLPQ